MTHPNFGKLDPSQAQIWLGFADQFDWTPADLLKQGTSGVYYDDTSSANIVRSAQPTPNDWDMEAVGIAAWNSGNFEALAKTAVAPYAGAQSLDVTGLRQVYCRQFGTMITDNRYRWSVYGRGDGVNAAPWLMTHYDMGPRTTNRGTTSTAWQNLYGEFTGDDQLRLICSTVGTVGFDELTGENLSITRSFPVKAVGDMAGEYCEYPVAEYQPWELYGGGGIYVDGFDILPSILPASATKFLIYREGGLYNMPAFTIAFVVEWDAFTGANQRIFTHNNNPRIGCHTNNGRLFAAISNGETLSVSPVGAVTTGSPQLIVIQADGIDTLSLRVNGALLATDTASSPLADANPGTTLRYFNGGTGSDQDLRGYCYDRLIIDQYLSGGRLAQLEQFFAIKHGITLA